MRSWCVAAGAAVVAFAASPAAAGEGCCWGGPTVVYAAPPVTIVVPPTGYVLDPSDARGPAYWVDQGAVYPGPRILSFGVPTYSEGGYAFPYDYPDARRYPYVRSYYGDGWFSAPRRFGWGYQPTYGRRVFGYRHYGYRPHVVNRLYGYRSYGYRWYGYRQYGYRHDGYRQSGYRHDGDRDRPRVVRAGVGYGHFAPPYDAYRYRPAPSARVIHVPPRMMMQRRGPQHR